MKKLILILTFLFTVTTYSQMLHFLENFEYGPSDDTSLVTLTVDWVRHSGAMGPAYSAAGLEYSGYPSSGSGGAVTFLNGSSGINDGDIHRLFYVSVIETDNVYTFFLLNITSARATADYFFHIGPDLIGTTFRGRVFARENVPGWSLGLSKSNETRVDDNTILNYGQTYLVALKYSFNTTAADDDQVTLYLYESGIPLVEPGSPLITIGPLGTGIGSDPANIGAAAIRQGGNTPTGKIDGIRISTSWQEIFVPVELSSFTASSNNNSVTINWSTASELNNSGFDVERKSMNTEWTKIGFVPGNGTTTEAFRYSFTDNNLTAGNYSYRLKQIDFDGTFTYSNEIEIDVLGVTEYSLEQNYPNPFNPVTTISWQSPVGGHQVLKVFDILGNEVATLVDEFRDAGRYEVKFQSAVGSKQLASGLYFYKLQAGEFTSVKKMILTK